MYIAIDADEGAPKQDAYFLISIYYVIFISGSILLLNLFTGVLFYRFTQAKKQEENPYGL